MFKNDNERPEITGGPLYQRNLCYIYFCYGLMPQIYKFQQLHFHWGDKGQIGSEHKIDNRG